MYAHIHSRYDLQFIKRPLGFVCSQPNSLQGMAQSGWGGTTGDHQPISHRASHLEHEVAAASNVYRNIGTGSKGKTTAVKLDKLAMIVNTFSSKQEAEGLNRLADGDYRFVAAQPERTGTGATSTHKKNNATGSQFGEASGGYGNEGGMLSIGVGDEGAEGEPARMKDSDRETNSCVTIELLISIPKVVVAKVFDGLDHVNELLGLICL